MCSNHSQSHHHCWINMWISSFYNYFWTCWCQMLFFTDLYLPWNNLSIRLYITCCYLKDCIHICIYIKPHIWLCSWRNMYDGFTTCVFNPLSVMVAIQHHIIVSFKSFSTERVIGIWIPELKCISERLTWAKSVFWLVDFGRMGCSSLAAHSTDIHQSLHNKSSRHSGG